MIQIKADSIVSHAGQKLSFKRWGCQKMTADAEQWRAVVSMEDTTPAYLYIMVMLKPETTVEEQSSKIKTEFTGIGVELTPQLLQKIISSKEGPGKLTVGYFHPVDVVGYWGGQTVILVEILQLCKESNWHPLLQFYKKRNCDGSWSRRTECISSLFGGETNKSLKCPVQPRPDDHR